MMLRCFQAQSFVRQRIPYMQEDFFEMHRNARVDYYPMEIANKIKESLDLTKLNRYPDVEKLQEKVAKFLKLDTGNILLTSGVDGGIKTVFEMCTKVGDKVVTLWPTYGMYDVYARAFGVENIVIKSKDDLSIDMQELLSAITQDVAAVFLPNPHQPVENIFTCAEVEIIAKKAQECEALLFVDEAYFMFGAETSLPLIDKYENVVIARSFSKGFGLPAIRIGFLVSNSALISYLETKRFAHETNSLSIEIACFALENYALFEEYITEVNASRDWLRKSLLEVGIVSHGSKSNSIIIDMGTSTEKETMASGLKASGYLVRSNMTESFDKYISVTIGSGQIMDGFLSIFMKLLQKQNKVLFA